MGYLIPFSDGFLGPNTFSLAIGSQHFNLLIINIVLSTMLFFFLGGGERNYYEPNDKSNRLGRKEERGGWTGGLTIIPNTFLVLFFNFYIWSPNKFPSSMNSMVGSGLYLQIMREGLLR